MAETTNARDRQQGADDDVGEGTSFFREAAHKPGTFWLYAGFAVCALAFFAFRVPETKNRSLEQIERDLGADPQKADEPAGSLS